MTRASSSVGLAAVPCLLAGLLSFAFEAQRPYLALVFAGGPQVVVRICAVPAPRPAGMRPHRSPGTASPDIHLAGPQE